MTSISYLNHGLRVWAIIGPMSYAITVTARGGQLTVEHSGDVPDGTHTISGHESPEGRQVGVTRNSPEGHQVASVGSHHSREH